MRPGSPNGVMGVGAGSPSHTERGSPGQFKNFPLISTRAGLRRLASNEGREGYSTGGGDGQNDHPGWESRIHVVSSQKVPVLKELKAKSRLGIKELRGALTAVQFRDFWNT
ncbi:hypothetical protein AVEN_181919-1 [Araneus ventricosus]|uniref:Uncharacterized protein n=1 Tax=Araneus ventricosus TaxID=182803 RepID=A0A4Y2AB84_ARAVE|nr:hypothetical protein AVEN_181919-1 [Araneus ventricosus]